MPGESPLLPARPPNSIPPPPNPLPQREGALSHAQPVTFVGIQIGPISFADEGVEPLLDMLAGRFGITALLVGTVSWLGLKVGRRGSHAIEGFPDHGVAAPYAPRGGSYIAPRPEFFARSILRDFAAADPELAGTDILARIIPAARARGMMVIPELMEPAFRNPVPSAAGRAAIPNLPQCLEIDLHGRLGPHPCTSNPDYRAWWHGLIEQHCRCYDIDGIMWCNERPSPLDRMIQGQPPGCFCPTCRAEAAARGIDVERARIAFRAVDAWFRGARAGAEQPDGALVGFLRVLLANPEVLLWERFWLERSKDLDRELYGIVKFCDARLQFGLNVWNRNHFNPIRKAQWSWDEQAAHADWVKPITYQHQAGLIYAQEMQALHASILRDFSPAEATPAMYRILGLDEAPWDRLVQAGMDPDSYVFGQCRDAVRGVGGRVPVYGGIGIDAPRARADQAACTPEIACRSVLAAQRGGAAGVVFSPNYATMNLANLDGAARGLRELGWMT